MACFVKGVYEYKRGRPNVSGITGECWGKHEIQRTDSKCESFFISSPANAIHTPFGPSPMTWWKTKNSRLNCSLNCMLPIKVYVSFRTSERAYRVSTWTKLYAYLNFAPRTISEKNQTKRLAFSSVKGVPHFRDCIFYYPFARIYSKIDFCSVSKWKPLTAVYWIFLFFSQNTCAYYSHVKEKCFQPILHC